MAARNLRRALNRANSVVGNGSTDCWRVKKGWFNTSAMVARCSGSTVRHRRIRSCAHHNTNVGIPVHATPNPVGYPPWHRQTLGQSTCKCISAAGWDRVRARLPPFDHHRARTPQRNRTARRWWKLLWWLCSQLALASSAGSCGGHRKVQCQIEECTSTRPWTTHQPAPSPPLLQVHTN